MPMRAILLLVAAVLFGLAGGYAWSAMSSPPVHVHVPKAVEPKPPPTPASVADRQWAERGDEKGSPNIERSASDPTQDKSAVEQSVYYPSCAAARASGHAPILQGQPGYRSGLDADGDGIACEPYRGN